MITQNIKVISSNTIQKKVFIDKVVSKYSKVEFTVQSYGSVDLPSTISKKELIRRSS
tara:strand:+ start:9927 stop:10097 length:171 start_codon:yes stop_codon:yes gene_type:complete